MSQHDETTTMIDQHLDAIAAAGGVWKAKWVAHAIINAKSRGLAGNEDAEFFRWTAYTAVRELVRRAIGKRAGDRAENDAPRQIELPGFDRQHLQDYYLVNRDGDDIGVPVVAMTDAELDAKREVYVRMGASCYAHAQELSRFKAWRVAQRAA